MKNSNFNLLNTEELTQLGFSKQDLKAIDGLRPLPNIFHLLKVPDMDSQRLGQLIQQGIVVSASDQQLVPASVSVLTEEDLALPDPDCFCGVDDDTLSSPVGLQSLTSLTGIGLTGGDPFAIFEPLNPTKPLKIKTCDSEVAIPLVGIGKVRQKVSLLGLTIDEEIRKVGRTVEFVNRFGRQKARLALVKALTKVVESALTACTNPKCSNPTLRFGPLDVDQLFATTLIATRPNGTAIDGQFVIYALYIAKITAFVGCTSRTK